MTAQLSRGFRDISLSFVRHPVTNDITVLKNEDAIKKSVINLVRTVTNERFFNPLLGTSVGSSLFELVNEDSFDFLEDEIEILLKNSFKLVTISLVYLFQPNKLSFYYNPLEYNVI